MWKGTSGIDVYRPSVLRCHVGRKNQDTTSQQAARIQITHLWRNRTPWTCKVRSGVMTTVTRNGPHISAALGGVLALLFSGGAATWSSVENDGTIGALDAELQTLARILPRTGPIGYLEHATRPNPNPVAEKRRSVRRNLDFGEAAGRRCGDSSGDLQTGDAQSPPIDLPIPLTDGRTARLTLPGGLTKDDVQLLRDIIPVYLGRVPTRDS